MKSRSAPKSKLDLWIVPSERLPCQYRKMELSRHHLPLIATSSHVSCRWHVPGQAAIHSELGLDTWRSLGGTLQIGHFFRRCRNRFHRGQLCSSDSCSSLRQRCSNSFLRSSGSLTPITQPLSLPGAVYNRERQLDASRQAPIEFIVISCAKRGALPSVHEELTTAACHPIVRDYPLCVNYVAFTFAGTDLLPEYRRSRRFGSTGAGPPVEF